MKVAPILCLVLAPGFAFAHGPAGHQNLKVLKSVQHKALDQGMKDMAKGLGVQCTACHVKNKWAVDDVAAKLEARTFLQAALATEDQTARDAALAPLLVALKKDAPKDQKLMWRAVDRWKQTVAPTKTATAASVPIHEESKIAGAMQPVLDAYFEIHDALAQDRVAGVAAAAKTIGTQSKSLKPELGKELSRHATALAAAPDLEKMRAAFKPLSEVLVKWAADSKSADVVAYECSMASASWLQRATEKDVRNPYYGSEMLSCGERVTSC